MRHVQLHCPGRETIDPMTHSLLVWIMYPRNSWSGDGKICQLDEDQVSAWNISGVSCRDLLPLAAWRKWSKTTNGLFHPPFIYEVFPFSSHWLKLAHFFLLADIQVVLFYILVENVQKGDGKCTFMPLSESSLGFRAEAFPWGISDIFLYGITYVLWKQNYLKLWVET